MLDIYLFFGGESINSQEAAVADPWARQNNGKNWNYREEHGHTDEQTHTYSSHCRLRVSFPRSLKQPRECMLSSTSGSSSVKYRMRPIHTLLGGGCSGHGSLQPDLRQTNTQTDKQKDTCAHTQYPPCWSTKNWAQYTTFDINFKFSI